MCGYSSVCLPQFDAAAARNYEYNFSGFTLSLHVSCVAFGAFTATHPGAPNTPAVCASAQGRPRELV